MSFNWLDTPDKLVLGLLTGLVFGFLLQRAGVTRYRVIVGQFLWADHTMLRTMVTAVVVGAVGVYAMHQLWDIPLHIKSAQLLAIIGGGAIFGGGIALLGYCPGTAVGAMADGSRHAIPGVIGMIVGAGVYAEIYPWVSEKILPVWDFEKVTLPGMSRLSPWSYILGMAMVAIIVFLLLRDRDKPPARASSGAAAPGIG